MTNRFIHLTQARRMHAPVAEDEAVAGAVHGLHPELLPLHVEGEHVLLVVLPVDGGWVVVVVFGKMNGVIDISRDAV